MTIFNLISFPTDRVNARSYGYEKLYEAEKAKSRIIPCKNLTDAVNHKNRAVLIALENYDLDEGALKLIAEKQKACFLTDFSVLINTYGTVRAIQLAKLRTFFRLCVRHGAYYTFADFAPSEFELRSARELMHIAILTGLNPGQAKFAMQMLKHYLDKVEVE